MNADVPGRRWSGLVALAASLRRALAASRAPRLGGGLALARDKPGLDRPIVDVPVPPVLILPLVGYRGRALESRVVTGQRVVRGEPLAPGLPASASGTVVAIESRPIAHPAGRDAPCVVIETDAARNTLDSPWPTLPASDALTLERLVACSVGGLGGAGFPISDKLAGVARGEVHTLVVNGAECEPGIACDEALMAIGADEIVAGALALARLAGARRCLVAVESDKPDAGAALRTAIGEARDTEPDVVAGAVALHLIEVAPVYPSGAERLLLRLVTGIDVPPGERPARRGLLCVNVATAVAAHRARLGEPSLGRIVTIGGGRAARPCNARVAFGTPLADVLDATGQGLREPDTRRRVGGPLSGFDVTSERVPVTATVNRIALEPPHVSPVPAPCIRCAACSDVCPVGLLPQELLRHARAGADAALERGGLDACLECGCCDVVCPSAIELTATFRHARGARLDARRRERDVARAETLHRRRERRLAERHDTRAGDPAPAPSPADASVAFPTGTDVAAAPGANSMPASAPADDPVAAALARARRRRRRKGGAGDGPERP